MRCDRLARCRMLGVLPLVPPARWISAHTTRVEPSNKFASRPAREVPAPDKLPLHPQSVPHFSDHELRYQKHMIFAQEKLPFVATLLIEHFRGLRIFRGSTSTARRAGRSTSQGSWSDQCVREAGASNAVCYTAEPCNEYKSTGKITRQASAGRKNGRRGTRTPDIYFVRVAL